MRLLMKEQRSLKRMKINLPVVYTYFGEYKFTVDNGTTADISDTGMGFYTDKPLRSGLTLDIKIPHLWDSPRTCVVRWNSMKSSDCFRVGVAFL